MTDNDWERMKKKNGHHRRVSTFELAIIVAVTVIGGGVAWVIYSIWTH